jgi:hypothetical protein
MSRNTARWFRSVAYLNAILTVIAVVLVLNLAQNLGLLSPKAAQATNVVPVQIEGVRGNIPVAIKEPVSTYPHSVCVSPCK